MISMLGRVFFADEVRARGALASLFGLLGDEGACKLFGPFAVSGPFDTLRKYMYLLLGYVGGTLVCISRSNSSQLLTTYFIGRALSWFQDFYTAGHVRITIGYACPMNS